MSMKQGLLAVALVTVLFLAAPRAQAQVVGGGYVGFGTPGFGGVVGFGTPMVAPAPVVPYVAPYPAIVARPMVVGPVVGAGWGFGPRFYGPRYYGPRYYRGGFARRW
jgi:hypothetical protein